MMKKIFCAAMVALAIIGCSKEEIAIEQSENKNATLSLNVSAYEVLTKNASEYNSQDRHLDSIRLLEVFVFREGGTLEVYKRFSVNDDGGINLSNIQIDATVGKKTVYVVANSKHTSWSGITTEQKFLNLAVPLKHENLRFFTMSARLELDLNQSKTIQVKLKKLISKVIVKSVKTEFAGGPYEGSTLKNAVLYLTNIQGEKSYIGEALSTPLILNNGKLSDSDVSGCYMTALFAEEIAGYIDDSGYNVPYHFYCYENMLDNETADKKFTRLVLKADLDGKTYYYPIDINQPGYGWNSSIDHKGVKRNTAYTYSFTVTGPGSDDPESKIVLKTITLDASAESIDKAPEFTVTF